MKHAFILFLGLIIGLTGIRVTMTKADMDMASASFRVPLTIDAAGGEFADPWWTMPQPPVIPSQEPLDTIVVRGRSYMMTKVAQGARPTVPQEARPREVIVHADAVVSKAKPEEKFGKWGRNPVRGGNAAWQLLLWFDASDAAESSARVELAVKVHAIEGNQPVTMSVHELEVTAWDEAAVTWATQPKLADNRAVATATAEKTDQIVVFDLTDFVKRQRDAGKPLALAIHAQGTRQVTLQGREQSGGYAPRLRLWSAQAMDTLASMPANPPPNTARAVYEHADQTLFFKGSGRGGRESRERLIIEDCTFVMDFKEGNFGAWDALRSAIYVEGYREVIVRRCTFVSKGLPGDPPRKTNASITVYDSLNVLIEDCTFEGKTNWMRGHITVFCSGPTVIRRVEIKGSLHQVTGRDGNARDVWASGGGIWVGNGLGEGKVGSMHFGNPDLMMYPSGPLVVEDCHIYNQTGRDNTDAIYIQSIHPFIVRNCRVENWRMDSLLDLGFRDTLGKSYGDAKLANHGAMGLVEHCQFGDGFIKISVGAGGGIVMRHNVFNDAWLMPYIFDGGNWYILNNQFNNVTGPLVSGRDGRTTGWAPKEGMFLRGGQVVWRNNPITLADTKRTPVLFMANPNGPKDYHPVNSDDPRLSDARDDAPLSKLPDELVPVANVTPGLIGSVGPRR